jgi:CBS domain-containing protein
VDATTKTLKAQDIMTREVMTFSEETTVREAAALLLERRISGAPVVDRDGKLSGVLSEEDLIGVFYEGHRNLEKTAIGTCSVLGSSLVTRKVISVRPETLVQEIAKKLMSLKIKRVPVVDGASRVVGVVSRKDILKALAGLVPESAAAEAGSTVPGPASLKPPPAP